MQSSGEGRILTTQVTLQSLFQKSLWYITLQISYTE